MLPAEPDRVLVIEWDDPRQLYLTSRRTVPKGIRYTSCSELEMKIRALSDAHSTNDARFDCVDTATGSDQPRESHPTGLDNSEASVKGIALICKQTNDGITQRRAGGDGVSYQQHSGALFGCRVDELAEILVLREEESPLRPR